MNAINGNVTQLLGEMERMQQMANAEAIAAPVAEDGQGFSFAEIMKNQIDSVNSLQNEASGLRRSFELGDPNTNLVDVMVATQKSSISFQALTQVRNKMLSAYQEVMSMQV